MESEGKVGKIKRISTYCNDLRRARSPPRKVEVGRIRHPCRVLLRTVLHYVFLQLSLPARCPRVHDHHGAEAIEIQVRIQTPTLTRRMGMFILIPRPAAAAACASWPRRPQGRAAWFSVL